MMTECSNYIAYVDESGGPDLIKPDPDFPVFVLTFCVFRVEDYVDIVVAALQRIKFKYFGHDMVVFHEREIRKATADFAFLTNKEAREDFMDDLNNWVEQSPFAIIAVVIDKSKFVMLRPKGDDPYHAAMKLGLERLREYIHKHDQPGRTLHIVFEARGRREDDALELEFRRAIETDNSFPCRIVFASKKVNSTGLQLADLTARPIGRHVMNRVQRNRAYELIATKLIRNEAGDTEGAGLICYP
jgi:hypothetical protein